MVGSCSTPPSASVAYAFARSSGLTAFTPSTIEGTGLSFDWIPIRFASSAIALGAEIEGETGEDRVVGEERRLRERNPARVRVLERVDVPVVRPDERSRQVFGRVRVDLPLHGLREDEELERRPHLPLTVHREVVGEALPLLGERHGADLAGLRIDRDDRARRVALSVERAEDRVRRLRLHLRVERRVDPQAALAHSLGAELVHELVRDEVGQIALARDAGHHSWVQAERAIDRSSVAAAGYVAGLEHRA